MNEHLTKEQVSLFLAGESTGSKALDIEAHIDGCASCRELISETVRHRHAHQEALASTVISATSKLPVSVGDVVDGRYRIDRLIGIGGMGCVFEAHHLHLNQRMALKFMLPDLVRDLSAVDRFTREARAAVRLVTEHVGRVVDLGSLPSGVPYLVMEFLQGETVEQRLLREGPLGWKMAVRLVRQAMAALEEAHALSIVHRDLKPANLFLARRSNGVEVLKVLDFGIAKSIDPDIEAGLGNTSKRTLLGSPLYMAPEQLSGRDIDARADIWALGCTLYQLLIGETPFRGTDLVELMYSIQTRPHPNLAQRLPQLKPLSEVIDACLQKAPENRLPSVAALAQRLDVAEAALARAHAVPSKPLPKPWVLAVMGVALFGIGAGGWTLLANARRAVAPPVTTMPARPTQVVVAPPVVVDAGAVVTAPIQEVTNERPTELPSLPSKPAVSPGHAVVKRAVKEPPSEKKAPEPAAKPDVLDDRL